MRKTMWDFGINSVLIDQLAKGNEKAFSFLVENYNHSLYVYANSLAADPERARDIVQNVFIKTWERRETLRTDLSITGFMYRAVYNEFIDQYRSNRSSMILERLYLDTLLQFETEPESGKTERIMEMVMNAVDNLPPKCKEVFLLSKKEGLTHLEIAEYLKISYKTVENQMTKAFSLIREKVNCRSTFFLFMGQMMGRKKFPLIWKKVNNKAMFLLFMFKFVVIIIIV